MFSYSIPEDFNEQVRYILEKIFTPVHDRIRIADLMLTPFFAEINWDRIHFRDPPPMMSNKGDTLGRTPPKKLFGRLLTKVRSGFYGRHSPPHQR